MSGVESPRSKARPVSKARANAEIGAVGLGALMAALTQTLVLPVLPTISRDLHASSSQTQWLLTSTLVVAAVSVPVVSRFADMFGRRRMLLLCLVALALGSYVSALTDNVGVMILGRAITGLSSAAIPLGISLLAVILPPERRGSAVALISSMLGVGSALGLPLAGLLADHVDYHVLYWLGAAGSTISIVIVRLLVSEPETGGRARIDWRGIVLLCSAVTCLIVPFSEGSTWGWGSGRTIGLFGTSAVLFSLLVRAERRTRAPLIDLRALANPPVAVTNVAAVFVGFALFASFVGTATYVQAPKSTGYGFGATILVAGFCLMPTGLLMLLLTPLTARLINYWGPARALSLGGAIIAVGLTVRIFAVGSLWEVVVGTTVVGVGSGIGYATLPSLINGFTPDANLSAANGLNSLARSFGSTLASAIGGSILASITLSVPGGSYATLGAYRVLFVICAVAGVLACVAGFLIPRLALRTARPATVERELLAIGV